MAAARIFSLFIIAMLPWAASAQQRAPRHLSAEEAVTAMRAQESQPVNAAFSRWVMLPGVMLEDVLYPAPDARGAVASASVVGTSSHVLRNGYSVALTTVRLDNSSTEIGATRPYDFLRCYEYF